MLSQLTIPKKNTQLLAMDRQQLYAIGLKHIQQLSSKIWTDYNLHDPGITTLELLCYALTDLSYRASFPIADLLASATDNPAEMKKQFFTARQILPNRPLTLLDYRKLLIDIKGVKNAWLQPASLSYYADILNHFNSDAEGILDPPRLGCATLFVNDIINLSSLAGKLNQPSDRLSQYLKKRLTTKTKETMSAYQATPKEQSLERTLKTLLVQDLNRIIQNSGPNGGSHSISLYDPQRFASVNLSDRTKRLLNLNKGEVDIERLNRMLLEDAYGQEISQNQWLRNKQDLKKVNLAGLYEVKIEYEVTTDKQQVMQIVQQKLQANRNLCEDFVQFNEVETQSFQLCAELELAPDADVTKVNAAILSQVPQYLSPSVKFYSLSEMLIRKKADGTPYHVDEIFDGPALDRGFIDNDELENADLRKEIRLSDIISIIMDIKGVQAVRDIVINPEENKVPLVNKWVIPVEVGKQAKLNLTRSRLVFYKRNMPVIAGSVEDVSSTVPPATEVKNDLEIPLGTYRDLAKYYSFQNHFPAIYGLSNVSLSTTAGDKRKALAYQLKAYLLFFDQIMANYMAQLSQVKSLFSIDPDLPSTYFSQVVDSFVDYNKIYATNNVINTLQAENNSHEAATGFERRHRFLDHLIARFAERFHDFANTMYSAFGESHESIIRYKCEFLQSYPTISQERSLAYNYSLNQNQDLWNTNNVSGLEKRLAKLLGIRNHQRRNLGDITYDVYAEVHEDQTNEFRFRIRKRDSLQIILSSSTYYSTQQLARTAMERAIYAALLPSGYQRKVATDGRHYFNIINDTGDILARRIEYFNTEAEMNHAIDEVMEYLKVNYSDEGMYLIENILLRPEQNTDPFLPICPTPDCTDCAEIDPYSYRIHIILPAYSSRFSNMHFRRFAEEVIREETPAHILPKICWINQENMAELEKLYRDWIYLKAGVEKTNREGKLRSFINKLFKVKSVYERQKLRECDSGEDELKFILGRTALGTEKTIETE